MAGPEAPTTATAVVRVEHHLFYLLDEGAGIHPPPPPPNGLIDSSPGLAIVFTGASSGLVNVTVEARRQPPPPPDTQGWDEIIDHSIHSPGGHLRVASLDGPEPRLPDLTAAGAGDYRVRVHARGRDTAPDAVATTPIEHYLIQAWPAPAAGDTVHQHRDQYGTELRASIRPAFHPPATATVPAPYPQRD